MSALISHLLPPPFRTPTISLVRDVPYIYRHFTRCTRHVFIVPRRAIKIISIFFCVEKRNIYTHLHSCTCSHIYMVAEESREKKIKAFSFLFFYFPPSLSLIPAPHSQSLAALDKARSLPIYKKRVQINIYFSHEMSNNTIA